MTTKLKKIRWMMQIEIDSWDQFDRQSFDDLLKDYAESFHQSKIDAITDDKIHYEALLDCCNKLLDQVEKGQVPKRQIMGLKLLLNRN